MQNMYFYSNLIFKSDLKSYNILSICPRTELNKLYRCISINYNMVTCQSANQLKTPAKVSWAFTMVSQFGSLGYTIMGKTADLTVVQKTIIDTIHKESKTQTFITKEAVHRVLYPSMFTESWVEGKSVEEKDAQSTERTAALWGLSSKINSRIWVNFTRNGLRLGSSIKSTTHRRVEEF